MKDPETTPAMMRKRLLVLLPAMLLGACAYHTSRSSMVIVTDAQKVVESCTKIGEIDGAAGFEGYVPIDKARDSILHRLKIRAAEMDGTHVLSSVADIKWKGLKSTGTVYRCNPG